MDPDPITIDRILIRNTVFGPILIFPKIWPHPYPAAYILLLLLGYIFIDYTVICTDKNFLLSARGDPHPNDVGGVLGREGDGHAELKSYNKTEQNIFETKKDQLNTVI
jgi:hypothetical protein